MSGDIWYDKDILAKSICIGFDGTLQALDLYGQRFDIDQYEQIYMRNAHQAPEVEQVDSVSATHASNPIKLLN